MNYNLLFLATTLVEASPTVKGNFDWRPLISSLILCIIAGILNYWFSLRRGASKRDTNHFIAFMDESAEFREEIRKDREHLKKELDTIHAERDSLKNKLVEYQEKYEECSKIVDRHTEQLSKYKEEIVDLHDKIKKLKEALNIVRLNNE